MVTPIQRQQYWSILQEGEGCCVERGMWEWRNALGKGVCGGYKFVGKDACGGEVCGGRCVCGGEVCGGRCVWRGDV